MQALIEEKKRQRTISNGSLDNCVITRDNRLIKVDPALFECKRSNSLIAKFKRSLGFSSQSLNRSKTSLNNIPSILVDLVNEHAKQGEAGSARMSPIYRPPSRQVSNPPSPSHSKLAGDLPESVKSDTSDNSSDSGVCVEAKGVEGGGAASAAMPAGGEVSEAWLMQLMQNEGTSATLTEVTSASGSTHSINNPVIVPGHHHPGLDGSIISVQVLPNFSSADNASFPRPHHRLHRSSETNSCYSNAGLSTSARSFVSRSFLSIPQGMSECSIEMLAEETEHRHRNGVLSMIVDVLKDMFDFHLLKNKLFGLLVGASVLTLLGEC
jgi:hypothetical protein